ncbi:dihydroxyacetone kinase subunit DhaL [Nocardioides marinquilinus]|uniref:Dihydroxyacetone kinase subunit DhaL n=2 Tax=Nocardioides marinquilinus TaxID=1210400 RepID=A0ABP9Q381_9ACTN
MPHGTITTDDLLGWLRALADAVHEQAGHLTELDAAIGDADHGSNLDRGFKAAVAAVGEMTDTPPGKVLGKVGMTLVGSIGGASGPLYGTFFLRCGTSLGETPEVDAAGWGAALRAGVEGVLARGKAERGDKTMYDAWAPALEAYDADLAGGGDLSSALAAAAAAAAQGRDATVELVARKGRASYLGERSAGHADPGATSTALLLQCAADTLG